MSKLNKDILFLLFEELQDDSKSLFSCLLVNRLWCETVIPILWRNPWCYEDVINYQNKNSLYSIITFSLPDDVKDFLTNQGIRISYQSPLFDYLSFCRSINMNVIKNIISSSSSSTYNQFLLQQEIYSLFIGKFLEIKYLNMRSIEHQIFYFSEAKTSFESLVELKCDISIDPIYFYGLACICKYIQRFIIINTGLKVNDGIVRLIDAQKNLRYFEWKDDFGNLDFDGFDFDNIYEKIFPVLEKTVDTLNHLIINLHYYEDYLSYMHIPINLSKFHKLKTLKINAPDYDIVNQLRKLVCQNLEILQIDNYIDIYTVDSIIKNSEGHLRKILIKGDYWDYSQWVDDEDNLNFPRTIYEN